MTWTPTENKLPEDNTPCRVITPSGDECDLTFYRGLWFLPDMSMYVYFTPVYWKVL